MKKILFVATVQSHIAQFHLPVIEMLQKQGYEVHVAARNNLSEKPGRSLETLDCVYDIPFSRFPYSKQNVGAYRALCALLAKENYDVVHCNTPVGGMLSRLACRKYRKAGLKVIYTVHGFHFYKGAPFIHWFLYYPLEKICAHWTDVLITINTEDYERAQKSIHAKKVCYVPGVGVDLSKFAQTNVDRSAKRKSLGLTDQNKVILSVGELNANKNHEVVIKALGELQNPNIHYVIAGNGPLKDTLVKLASQCKVPLHLIGYRADIAEIYPIADLFVLPSLREGLPLAVMEAMVNGLPCVVSAIRGSVDLIVHKQGGFLISEEKEYRSSFQKLLIDEALAKAFGTFNRTAVVAFDVCNIQKKLSDVYREVYYESNSNG